MIRKEKLGVERTIFYLLIFTIPVQARLVLFEWTKPFNQWASAYLYGTDILISMLFILWLLRSAGWGWKISNFKIPARNATHSFAGGQISKEFLKSNPQIINSPVLWLAIFFVVSTLSVFNSQIVGLSLYQLLKLAEFVGFYFYLRSSWGRVFNFKTTLAVVVASGFVQSAIAIIQYAKQGSVGLRVLGESPLSVNTAGVAVFIVDGAKYLRAYGLTPHPNILAAWLFTAIFAFYFLHLSISQVDKLTYRLAMSIGVYIALLFGLFFTFSRVIIGLWVLSVSVLFPMAFLRNQFWDNFAIRRKILRLVIASLAAIIIFFGLFWPQVKSRLSVSPTEEAVTQRVFYNKEAAKIAEDNPWLGVGIGQFIPEMMQKMRRLPSHAYQPVHNIYLLIASEAGFIGLGAFLAFLFSVFRRFFKTADFSEPRNLSFLILVFSFLIFGLFDHFLWTSQQGAFFFWMALAFSPID